MKSVNAVFANNNVRYSYLVPDGEEPEVGDWILTSVNFVCYDEATGMYGKYYSSTEIMSNAKFAKIIEVELVANPKAKKFYIHLFSEKVLKERQTENRKLIDKWTKKKNALNKLNEMLQRENDLERFERLAAKNEKARELLDLLKDSDNSSP